MTMHRTIREQILERQDPDYGDFQSRLIPTIPRTSILGVRVPHLRQIAKIVRRSPELPTFLGSLPHDSYEENMLHAILLSEMKDKMEVMTQVNAFLPYIDNWAVCDILAPKVWGKHPDLLLAAIPEWIRSTHGYTSRFGIGMLMRHFLGEDFAMSHLELPLEAPSDDYYVKMMQAWFYATALAKQWPATLEILTRHRLDRWTHNKTIQKAIESTRVSDEHKAQLRRLRRS